jgi:hypothetical protein
VTTAAVHINVEPLGNEAGVDITAPHSDVAVLHAAMG